MTDFLLINKKDIVNNLSFTLACILNGIMSYKIRSFLFSKLEYCNASKLVRLDIQPNHIEITLPDTVTASLNLEELVWLFAELVDVLGSTNSLAILGWLDFFSAEFVDLLVLAGIEKVFSSSIVMAISQNMLLLFCFC
jgi:hypothetical protein